MIPKTIIFGSDAFLYFIWFLIPFFFLVIHIFGVFSPVKLLHYLNWPTNKSIFSRNKKLFMSRQEPSIMETLLMKADTSSCVSVPFDCVWCSGCRLLGQPSISRLRCRFWFERDWVKYEIHNSRTHVPQHTQTHTSSLNMPFLRDVSLRAGLVGPSMDRSSPVTERYHECSGEQWPNHVLFLSFYQFEGKLEALAPTARAWSVQSWLMCTGGSGRCRAWDHHHLWHRTPISEGPTKARIDPGRNGWWNLPRPMIPVLNPRVAPSAGCRWSAPANWVISAFLEARWSR